MARLVQFSCDRCGVLSEVRPLNVTKLKFNDFILSIGTGKEFTDCDVCEKCRLEMAYYAIQKVKEAHEASK